MRRRRVRKLNTREVNRTRLLQFLSCANRNRLIPAQEPPGDQDLKQVCSRGPWRCHSLRRKAGSGCHQPRPRIRGSGAEEETEWQRANSGLVFGKNPNVLVHHRVLEEAAPRIPSQAHRPPGGSPGKTVEDPIPCPERPSRPPAPSQALRAGPAASTQKSLFHRVCPCLRQTAGWGSPKLMTPSLPLNMEEVESPR